MSDELTEFTWRVPKNGFRWCTASTEHSTPHRVLGARPTPGRFLVSAIPDTHLQPGTEYPPLLTHTGLFKQLADTPATEEGILQFANKYGHLGGVASVPIAVPGEPDTSSGEPFEEWKVSILRLRDIVLTWEAAHEPNKEILSAYIRWEPGGVFYRSVGDATLIASETAAELMARFTPGDLVMPAMYIVQRRINERLSEYGVTPKLLWNRSEGGLVLRLSAHSLIGAIWLQFAKAVEGNKEYKQCQNARCRRWIEVGGNRTARSDKKFCSPSCKSDAHRRKSEQASRMHQANVEK